MIERIRKICAGLEEVSAWKLNITQKQSSELFFVGKKLETNRAADTTAYQLTIYVDGADTRGAAVFPVYPFMSDEELQTRILENIYAAHFAMNPWYAIPKSAGESIPESSSNIRNMSLKEAAEKVADAIFKADVYEGGYLSATEIFIEKTLNHIVNSEGVDIHSVTFGGQAELIPSWEKSGEEVEVYHMLKFESVDEAELTAQVDEQLRIAAGRFVAKPLNEVINVSCPPKVIIQDEEVGEIFRYFADDLDYSTKYQKANKFELNENVQGDSVTGTSLTLTMKPYVKDAFNSSFFDNDGVILKPVTLVCNGIAVNRKGSYRFGFYLGEKEPAGQIPVLTVEPGTKSFAEMAAEPYLRCKVFSGIQVEPNSGYFGGEVRLGYYFDGEKEIPVTGFSVSGDMNVSRGSMVYSSDVITTDAYSGPKYLEIKDMKLA